MHKPGPTGRPIKIIVRTPLGYAADPTVRKVVAELNHLSSFSIDDCNYGCVFEPLICGANQLG
jgi:hypothetical protein